MLLRPHSRPAKRWAGIVAKSLLKEVSQTGIDVKVDRGGIRDIEFLVQCLQRVYGGSESWLRSRGTLFALQKLHDKEHISGKDFHNLTNAYEFLRNLEHRLQLRQGQQDASPAASLAPNCRAWPGALRPKERLLPRRKNS